VEKIPGGTIEDCKVCVFVYFWGGCYKRMHSPLTVLSFGGGGGGSHGWRGRVVPGTGLGWWWVVGSVR
jgi:hypothetical protein